MPRKSAKPKPRKKSGRLTHKQGPPRDANGRFVKTKPTARKPAQKPLRLRDAFGRFVAVKPQPKKRRPAKPIRTRVIKQDKNGRFRDEFGRYVHVEMAPVKEGGHHDGRKNDGPRVRTRLTFQEMVDLYGFDDYAELPEWLQYLEGSPG